MKASNPARTVIATALALSCAIGLAGCGGAAPAATVNGTPVAEETVAAYIDDFRATSSLEDDGAWATWLADNGYTPQSVRQEVVDYYVDEELVRQAARERGVSADAAEVDEAVQKAKEGYESDEALARGARLLAHDRRGLPRPGGALASQDGARRLLRRGRRT